MALEVCVASGTAGAVNLQILPLFQSFAALDNEITSMLGEGDSEQEPEPIDRHELIVSVPSLRVPPKAWRHYEKGLEAQRRGDYDKALSQYHRALEVYPDFGAASAAQGITLLWQKKPAEARDAFLRALAVDPDTFQAELGLGLICNTDGRFDEAVGHLQKALALNGECWQVRYALGRAHYGLGHLPESEKHLTMARAAKPTHGNLYLLLALVQLAQDKPAEALAQLETFLRVAPEDALAGEVRARIQELRAAGE